MPKQNEIFKLEDCIPVSKRGRRYRNLTVMENTDIKCILKSFPALYREAIVRRKREIDMITKQVYGRPLRFQENETTNIRIKLYEIEQQFGKNFAQIANDINQYVGSNLCFFRNIGEKRIPVEFERITKAYQSVQEKKTKNKVLEVLYKD